MPSSATSPSAQNAESKRSPKGDVAIGGGALLMILCCAIGPAVIGAAAGGFIGGWLGIACAVVLAGVVGLMLRRRSHDRGC